METPSWTNGNSRGYKVFQLRFPSDVRATHDQTPMFRRPMSWEQMYPVSATMITSEAAGIRGRKQNRTSNKTKTGQSLAPKLRRPRIRGRKQNRASNKTKKQRDEGKRWRFKKERQIKKVPDWAPCFTFFPPSDYSGPGTWGRGTEWSSGVAWAWRPFETRMRSFPGYPKRAIALLL